MKIITREEAKKIGQKWYFTGEPCKHGHVDKIEIKPNMEHQLMALSNSIIVEVSTTDFPEDSIRIEKGD